MPDAASDPPAPPIADLRIRVAEPADHAVIRELFVSSLVDGQLRGNDTGADIENLEQAYFSDDGASGFWVAELDGSVVGMIGVQNTRDNVAEIRRLRVAEPYRRHGIGSQLMRHAIEFCRSHGYLKVILDVRVERAPAVALFEKFGLSLSRTRSVDSHQTLEFYLDLYRENPG